MIHSNKGCETTPPSAAFSPARLGAQQCAQLTPQSQQHMVGMMSSDEQRRMSTSSRGGGPIGLADQQLQRSASSASSVAMSYTNHSHHRSMQQQQQQRTAPDTNGEQSSSVFNMTSSYSKHEGVGVRDACPSNPLLGDSSQDCAPCFSNEGKMSVATSSLSTGGVASVGRINVMSNVDQQSRYEVMKSSPVAASTAVNSCGGGGGPDGATSSSCDDNSNGPSAIVIDALTGVSLAPSPIIFPMFNSGSSASSQLRLLLWGDVCGAFGGFMEALARAVTKFGSFDACLCVGEFFGHTASTRFAQTHVSLIDRVRALLPPSFASGGSIGSMSAGVTPANTHLMTVASSSPGVNFTNHANSSVGVTASSGGGPGSNITSPQLPHIYILDQPSAEDSVGAELQRAYPQGIPCITDLFSLLPSRGCSTIANSLRVATCSHPPFPLSRAAEEERSISTHGTRDSRGVHDRTGGPLGLQSLHPHRTPDALAARFGSPEASSVSAAVPPHWDVVDLCLVTAWPENIQAGLKGDELVNLQNIQAL